VPFAAPIVHNYTAEEKGKAAGAAMSMFHKRRECFSQRNGREDALARGLQ
jgi:hypothetical protein